MAEEDIQETTPNPRAAKRPPWLNPYSIRFLRNG